MLKNSTKKEEIKIDELALMVAKGFDKMNEKMDKGFKEVNSDISELKTDVEEIKEITENIEANLNKKVDKVDHNTLIYRVEKLEEKFV